MLVPYLDLLCQENPLHVGTGDVETKREQTHSSSPGARLTQDSCSKVDFAKDSGLLRCN